MQISPQLFSSAFLRRLLHRWIIRAAISRFLFCVAGSTRQTRQKLLLRDIDERYMLRLGHGVRRWRVRRWLLPDVDSLSMSLATLS